MRNLHRLLQRSRHAVSRHRSLFAYNVFGHLSPRERKADCSCAYLASVEKYYPDPRLHPLTKCVGPRDGCQLLRWDMPSIVQSVSVSWMKHRVYIASGNGIQVWCIKSQQQLFVMEGHTDEVRSVAISSDGKRIVSGSDDNTVQRWDADTGLPVGYAMEGHTNYVYSVAVSSDGKRIVSGSSDNTVRRWDADTGLPVGDAMEGWEVWDVLENTRAQARDGQCDFRQNGIDVLPSGTACHSVTSDGRKIVMGLGNGCVVVCEVRLPT